MLAGFSAKSGKNLWLGNFSNLELNTRLPRKKARKLDVIAFCEKIKRFNFQIHLIIIRRDLRRPTSTNMKCVRLLTQQDFGSKIPIYNPNIAWYVVFKPPYLPTHEINFCKKTKVFISNFHFISRAEFIAFD